VNQPETLYAKSGDVHIAYQVVGKGPLDLVFVPGWWSHLDLWWEEPSIRPFVERLASFSRLIMFDKRGTGLSGRVTDTRLFTLEDRMDDVRAVMDAAGSKCAALFGISEGGPMSMLFAATYPERISAMVLYGTNSKWLTTPDYPYGFSSERFQELISWVEPHWGKDGIFLKLFAPSFADDENFRQMFTRWERRAASPATAVALLKMVAEIDVRHLLPSIRVPTLVLHRTGDQAADVNGARWMAQQIPGAKFVELPGNDHMMQDESVADEIEEFLTGARHSVEPDRVLATVLFNDIVGSTEKPAALGDRRWRDTLEAYRRTVRGELQKFRGREVNTAGDGFLATFDGPARAIRSACAIRDAVRTQGIDVRTGLHTGECELIGDDVGGIAVHIGARVASVARPGEVLVSSTVKDLVAGSGIRFADRGAHALKGLPGEWRLYAVE
jgi:pimeloyl-ACP methyl ester carboxylesterase